MSLKIFADHCLPNSLIESLRKDGHKIVRLRDQLPTHSPDTLVILKAKEINAILISLNGDFADIINYPPRDYSGIVSLQLKNQPSLMAKLLPKLRNYFNQHPDMEHYKGKLFVFDFHRVRIWE